MNEKSKEVINYVSELKKELAKNNNTLENIINNFIKKNGNPSVKLTVNTESSVKINDYKSQSKGITKIRVSALKKYPIYDGKIFRNYGVLLIYMSENTNLLDGWNTKVKEYKENKKAFNVKTWLTQKFRIEEIDSTEDLKFLFNTDLRNFI